MNKRVVGLVCILLAIIVGGNILFQQSQPNQVGKEEKVSERVLATTNKAKKTIELGKSVCDTEASKVMLEYVSDRYVVQQIPNNVYSSSLQVMDLETKQCETIMTVADFQNSIGMYERIIWIEGEQKGEQAYSHIKQYDLRTKEKKHIGTVKKYEEFPGLSMPALIEQDKIVYWVEMEKRKNTVTSTLMMYDIETGEKKEVERLQAVQQGEGFTGGFYRDIIGIEDTLVLTKDITNADHSKTRLLQIKKKDSSMQERELHLDDSAPVYVYGDYRVDTYLGEVSVTSMSTGRVLFHYFHEDETAVYSNPLIRGGYFYVNEGGKKIIVFDMETGEQQDVLEAESVLDLFTYDDRVVVYSRDNGSLFVHVLE
ncbi:hypothetical protein [Priestia taiwanensis]|uniref:Uncharacterized protein n=1 Tax=Priestia taiwanensis TaxID=1347902 RepID=A0A917AJM1_9BACI|nr:hypothetical protein [Priestia taiwanensis]MBM7361908.1 hypothetical protein [Priestia taiwanensis]GGE57915.1 hypothetical protein GCM10007140_05360 [Priestia taiwanensis]